jgi:hypothetical protein
MKEKTFNFEIKDSVTQFISAFDDVVISRYNKQREEQHRLNVRYLYAPKQRVIHDLVNKSKHITLPVISVSISSIVRDNERVFNKIQGSYHTRIDQFAGESIQTKTDHLKSPVPVNIGINMSILAKYQSDLDQILSNFIPHNNPYIVISWKVPEGLLQNTQELRSNVLWDGSINVNYPNDLSASDQYRVAADTTFTIKSWLFKTKDEPVGNIFKITSNFTPIVDIE